MSICAGCGRRATGMHCRSGRLPWSGPGASCVGRRVVRGTLMNADATQMNTDAAGLDAVSVRIAGCPVRVAVVPGGGSSVNAPVAGAGAGGPVADAVPVELKALRARGQHASHAGHKSRRRPRTPPFELKALRAHEQRALRANHDSCRRSRMPSRSSWRPCGCLVSAHRAHCEKPPAGHRPASCRALSGGTTPPRGPMRLSAFAEGTPQPQSTTQHPCSSAFHRRSSAFPLLSPRPVAGLP